MHFIDIFSETRTSALVKTFFFLFTDNFSENRTSELVKTFFCSSPIISVGTRRFFVILVALLPHPYFNILVGNVLRPVQ